MNAVMPHKTPGRLADLNPFNVAVSAAAPPQIRKAGRCDAGENSLQVALEYGCVDWYQYHDPAHEEGHALRSGQCAPSRPRRSRNLSCLEGRSAVRCSGSVPVGQA
jgi:hypothetical protein